MRVGQVELQNFASYEKASFHFDDSGLTLIHGPTGAGKSTLCDAIPWILFGKTAKGGGVDEVLTWPGDKVTTGTIWLDNVTISRSRGPKAKDNDLTFWPTDGVVTRGKDLSDTQKLINSFLGLDYELYLAGAYFHEFSQTAQFFTTTAKNRRTICEQLVDLSLPKKLQEKIKEQLKEVQEQVDGHEHNITMLESKLKTLLRAQEDENNRSKNWNTNQAIKIKQANNRVLMFEENRALRVEQVIKRSAERAKSKVCSECGAIKTAATHRHEDSNLEIVRIENEENPYVEQYQDLVNEENPHKEGVKDFSNEIENTKSKLAFQQGNAAALEQESAELDMLSDAIVEFRSLLIKNTILDLEGQTNVLLSNHFDAEIKVELNIEDSDKLDISITKNGNNCSYTQLSKGQRQLLKLCFGVSVMKCVSNHHGINFEQLFFDEATDGMDESNKAKSVNLLETLALDKAIYLVDHSEHLKAMINNKFKVELIDNRSVINAEA